MGLSKENRIQVQLGLLVEPKTQPWPCSSGARGRATSDETTALCPHPDTSLGPSYHVLGSTLVGPAQGCCSSLRRDGSARITGIGACLQRPSQGAVDVVLQVTRVVCEAGPPARGLDPRTCGRPRRTRHQGLRLLVVPPSLTPNLEEDEQDSEVCQRSSCDVGAAGARRPPPARGLRSPR